MYVAIPGRGGGREGGSGGGRMPSPRNRRRPDRPRRGRGGERRVLFPREHRPSSPPPAPAACPTLLPRRRVLCPARPPQRRREPEQPDPPHLQAAAAAAPAPSRRARVSPVVFPAPGALPLLDSGEPAALLPRRRLPRSRRRAAPPLPVPAGGRPAAASCHRPANPPSLPSSRGRRHLAARRFPPSRGVAPGHPRQGCSHLLWGSAAPQPRRWQAHLRPVPEPAAGGSCGGGAGDGDGLCREVAARSVATETRQSNLSAANKV